MRALAIAIKHLEGGLAGALLFLGLCIVTMEILGRSGFGVSFIWSEEASRYILIWLTYFGFAAATRANANIRVAIIFGLLPHQVRRWLEFLICIVCLIFASFVFWYGMRLVQDSRMFGIISADSDLPIPIWMFQAIVPIGYALVSLRLIERMVLLVLRPGMDVTAETESL